MRISNDKLNIMWILIIAMVMDVSRLVLIKNIIDMHFSYLIGFNIWEKNYTSVDPGYIRGAKGWP